MPSARQQFESVEALHAALLVLLTPGLTYVDPGGELAGFNPRLSACFSQRYRLIGTEAEFHLVSAVPIAEGPCLAGGPYAKVKALPISQQVFLVARLRGLDLRVVKTSHCGTQKMTVDETQSGVPAWVHANAGPGGIWRDHLSRLFRLSP